MARRAKILHKIIDTLDANCIDAADSCLTTLLVYVCRHCSLPDILRWLNETRYFSANNS